MSWFTFALLTALSVALHDTWVKKWFSHLSAYEMFAFPLLYSLPLILISLLFIDVPPLDRMFYIAFFISLPFNAVPFFMYIKAIQISPLSLTVPYLAFTPVFMIGTGFLMLDEVPDIWGFVGIAAVCVGSYVLNINPKNRSFAEPLKAVFRETGSWMMLIVSFIFSISAVLGKLAILHSSVMFFQMSFFAVLNIWIIIITRLIYPKIPIIVRIVIPGIGRVRICQFGYLVIGGMTGVIILDVFRDISIIKKIVSC